MLKRAFFGGFKYNLLYWIFFLVSILFILLNLISLFLTIVIGLNTWTCLYVFENIIFFDDDIIIPKLAVQGSLETIIAIVQIILFIKSIGYSIFMCSVKSENGKLERQNQEVNNNSKEKKEEGFEFVGLDMKPYYFQPINNTKLPQNLLYIRTENKKRTIFISENPDVIIQGGVEIFKGYSDKNNNIKNIVNDLDIKNTASEEQRLNTKKDDNNNNYHETEKNIRVETTNPDISFNKMNNTDKDKDNDTNEIARITHENKEYKIENEKLKQEIQNIKNKIEMMKKSKK